MAKADLHCHSKFSDYPSNWALKAYDSPESFTEPEDLYRQAKARGMDLVTITDHDDIRGCLELQKSHPDDTFISCEITTYFPEDNCKIHVLVYGINEAQFEELNERRQTIYDLRNTIVEHNIAYSVAHATYDQDGKLSFDHIEKLVVLFDVFEVINGGADEQNNTLLHRYLHGLTPEVLAQLQAKHKLTPMSEDAWVKGYTGGSDDHCGILIGSAYTQSLSNTKETFLTALRNKSSFANGMHGSFETYATSVIKHIHDYRSHRDDKYHKSKMSDFLEMFFVGEQGNWVKRFKKSHSLRYLKRKNTRIHGALRDLLIQISDDSEQDIAEKIPTAYQHITHMHDEMFRSIVTAMTKSVPNGDIFKVFNRLATLFPMTLLAMPFVGSMRHQVLKSELKRSLIQTTKGNYTEKALWFTDTIDDLNGVSVTLRQIADHGLQQGYQLKLVTCVDPDTLTTALPENAINFVPIKKVVVPGYEQQSIGFPSLLTMMKKIIDEQPDQIIISTPGPLGLGAMLCAKLMDLPIKAVYHTDFAEQLLRMTDEPMLANITDMLVNAFYKQVDEVFVPSKAYIQKLQTGGIEREKMQIFPRGLDLQLYSPAAPDSPEFAQAEALLNKHRLNGYFTLLFAGRISEDKNLTLLAQTFKRLNQQHPGLYNLVIAGDGPDLEPLKASLRTEANVHFTHRVASQALVDWYRIADLLVFPSHTDTFGMVVLEAQACGLPCLVTNTGGPKEIIDPSVTGQIVYSDAVDDWLNNIVKYQRLKVSQPEKYRQIRALCAEHVYQQNSWQPVFDSVLGDSCRLPQSDLEEPTSPNNTPTNNGPSINSPTDGSETMAA